MFNDYDFINKKNINDSVNLGLAHGIPSILKFCIECIKKSICIEQAEGMAKRIIKYTIENMNVNRRECYFPLVIKQPKIQTSFSRLAWCYGDLSIGFILYQAGIVFEDQKIIDCALEVLKHSPTRRTIEQTMVYDAGICHGSSGIAHIYNKMWHFTKDPVFKEATDFWIQKTLDFAIYDDGVAGYKLYNPTNNVYENSYGLLEGVVGIGLVFLSYLTGDFSWDYCLMLND